MENKLRVQLLVALLMIVVGSGLLIAGFIVPPLGIIDHTVLIAVGEILTFVGSLFGIDYNYKYKIYSRAGNGNKEKKYETNT